MKDIVITFALALSPLVTMIYIMFNGYPDLKISLAIIGVVTGMLLKQLWKTEKAKL